MGFAVPEALISQHPRGPDAHRACPRPQSPYQPKPRLAAVSRHCLAQPDRWPCASDVGWFHAMRKYSPPEMRHSPRRVSGVRIVRQSDRSGSRLLLTGSTSQTKPSALTGSRSGLDCSGIFHSLNTLRSRAHRLWCDGARSRVLLLVENPRRMQLS
jgi:hypothetical protein